ncbi:hypothetical protein D3C84_1303670 [compost metagenome]
MNNVVPGVARVVDDDVDAIEVVHRRLDVAVGEVRGADIAVAHGGLATHLADQLGGFLCRV